MRNLEFSKNRNRKNNSAFRIPYSALQRLFHAVVLLALFSAAAAAETEKKPSVDSPADPNLVRVSIISEYREPGGMIELDGRILRDYSPTIIQEFSSAGIVFDTKGHVMTFLSYLWVYLQPDNLRIEIAAADGKKIPGKLIGIDQRSGVAVIRPLNGKLEETRVCAQCEGGNGAIVMVPAGVKNSGAGRFGEAQVVSTAGSEAFRISLEQPVADIGLPVLNRDLQVIGLMAGDDFAVYPVQPLLDSARQVLKKGGDIHAGWLGVMLLDAPSGVMVQRVEPDSPAQAAGLIPRDFLRRYNNLVVQSARQFIRLVENSEIGSIAKIEISRLGKPMNITAKIRERQTQPAQNRLSLNSPKPLIGLDTWVLTPDMADALQMPGQTGLLVFGVVPNTPAARAGVLEGDVITAMDGQAVFDEASFASWESHRLGSQLSLTILRKGVKRVILVKISE